MCKSVSAVSNSYIKHAAAAVVEDFSNFRYQHDPADSCNWRVSYQPWSLDQAPLWGKAKRLRIFWITCLTRKVEFTIAYMCDTVNRFYPVAPNNSRILNDVVLSGYKVPAGVGLTDWLHVTKLVWTCHHNYVTVDTCSYANKSCWYQGRSQKKCLVGPGPTCDSVTIITNFTSSHEMVLNSELCQILHIFQITNMVYWSWAKLRAALELSQGKVWWAIGTIGWAGPGLAHSWLRHWLIHCRKLFWAWAVQAREMESEEQGRFGFGVRMCVGKQLKAKSL